MRRRRHDAGAGARADAGAVWVSHLLLLFGDLSKEVLKDFRWLRAADRVLVVNVKVRHTADASCMRTELVLHLWID